jgi:hypothetical protein
MQCMRSRIDRCYFWRCPRTAQSCFLLLFLAWRRGSRSVPSSVSVRPSPPPHSHLRWECTRGAFGNPVSIHQPDPPENSHPPPRASSGRRGQLFHTPRRRDGRHFVVRWRRPPPRPPASRVSSCSCSSPAPPSRTARSRLGVLCQVRHRVGSVLMPSFLCFPSQSTRVTSRHEFEQMAKGGE